MTVEQILSDLDDLVDTVCQRLLTTKVAIFGHSWGSALGVLYAARFPHKVAVYVGSAQPSTMRSFRFSLDAMWVQTSRLNLLDLVWR